MSVVLKHMKSLFQSILAWAARLMIKRFYPEIIAVTGSVGKTSTRQAIWTVLRTRFDVRQSEKNYNNEIGLPLTILGMRSPISKLGWISVLLWVVLEVTMRRPRYPRILILEMGADRPGDLAKLVAIARPSISVLTSVAPAHIEFFPSMDALAEEKATILRALPADGVAVISRDNELAWAQRSKTAARVMGFGLHPDADVRGVEIQSSIGLGPEIAGAHFKLTHRGSAVPVHLPGVVGKAVVAAAFAAAAVGIEKGMNLVEISEALRSYVAPAGRLRVIPGIKHTTILDDTYNASPASMREALEVLRESDLAEGAQKIAILGDMLELGTLTQRAHREVGALVPTAGTELLVTVGERATDIGTGAREAGFPEERIAHFGTPTEAARFVQDRLREGDLVLVKGSQGMRMEFAVKELMAEPLRANELLVRQDPSWKI